MSEDTRNKERRKPWGCMVVVLGSIPVLYLAGAGPAGWMHSHIAAPAIQKAIETAYLPLRLTLEFAGHDSWFYEAMRWYVGFWQ